MEFPSLRFWFCYSIEYPLTLLDTRARMFWRTSKLSWAPSSPILFQIQFIHHPLKATSTLYPAPCLPLLIQNLQIYLPFLDLKGCARVFALFAFLPPAIIIPLFSLPGLVLMVMSWSSSSWAIYHQVLTHLVNLSVPQFRSFVRLSPWPLALIGYGAQFFITRF